MKDFAKGLGVINDQSNPSGLTALARAAAAWQYRNRVLPRYR